MWFAQTRHYKKDYLSPQIFDFNISIVHKINNINNRFEKKTLQCTASYLTQKEMGEEGWGKEGMLVSLRKDTLPTYKVKTLGEVSFTLVKTLYGFREMLIRGYPCFISQGISKRKLPALEKKPKL